MWPSYINSTLEHLPRAEEKIVFDRFHIMMHVSRTVDAVRKQEHRQLAAEHDERLKGTKYLWLYTKENLPEPRRTQFKALFNQDPKVGRVWAIKKALRSLWHYDSESRASRHFKRWFFWATHLRLHVSAPSDSRPETIETAGYRPASRRRATLGVPSTGQGADLLWATFGAIGPYSCKSRQVWRAMTSSSLQWMTHTGMRLPAALTMGAPARLASRSRSIPSQASFAQMRARISGARSPMPPVNASTSSPPRAATREPTSRTAR